MIDRPGPDAAMLASLQRGGLVDDVAACTFEALPGGVSSDIWKVVTPQQTFCVKRALARLKVAADWQVPIARNAHEVRFYRVAQRIDPGVVPAVLYHDESEGLFAMRYLDPSRYRLWKPLLRDGEAQADVAAAIGARLLRLHAATVGDAAIAELFPDDTIFQAIRLEPYLEATALAHPDLGDTLLALSRQTRKRRLALIHGDVSPKNILVSDAGPVLLDAECACLGDPAFDLAFCLNHLLLKSLWNPAARSRFNECYTAMAAAYLAGVDWEPVADLEARTASLLPALLMARVDGKSPVEYITHDQQRAAVRDCARPLIASPPARLDTVLAAWNRELDR